MPTSEATIAALIRARGGVISLADARQAGLPDSALRWAEQSGRLHKLRNGVYTASSIWERASPRIQHILKIMAHQRIHPEAVACAISAAVVLNLPTPSGPPEQPLMITPRNPLRQGARGSQAGALRRRAWLSPEEIRRTAEGIRITTPIRTVLDCAREWPRPWGLAIGDAAVTNWNVSPEDLIAAAARRPPAPGTERARWVAEHARVGPESPLESLGRGVVVCAGLPEPALQVWIETRLGRYRVDMLDSENNVIIEADGRVKYAVADDLWEEKRREDALREMDFEVARFTMQDYGTQKAWLESYRRALARGAARKSR